MKHLFVPYEPALALKELGFKEDCLALYVPLKDGTNEFEIGPSNPNKKKSKLVSAPTFSQAFIFFREKYQLHQYIKQYYGEKFYFQIEDMVHPRRFDEYTVEMLRAFNESTSQEEAELACLKKLIEIVNLN